MIHRKTKIVCTLGPATEDDAVLRELILSGMNVARLNFSHGTHETHLNNIRRIEAFRRELNLPIAIMLDTKGPEIRLETFENGKVQLKKGQTFTLVTQSVVGNAERASITYPDLPRDIREGTTILIDDGLVEMTVRSLTAGEIVCIVNNDGMISDRKSVNVPDVDLSMPYLSPKDREDIAFGVKNGVDFIAASFTRTAEDILDVRKLFSALGRTNVSIIAKIENMQGVQNIDEILRVSDGIMVARGDLGVEIPLEKVPVIQKMLIHKAYSSGKQVITATQMLDSMMKNPRPTRAEAADVANAIYDGTSAIMLSGETAAGQYPVEAVQTMARIAMCAEADINYRKRFKERDTDLTPDVTNAISHATCTSAHDLGAAAILTVTKGGRTARMISKYRPSCPIICCTTDETVFELGRDSPHDRGGHQHRRLVRACRTGRRRCGPFARRRAGGDDRRRTAGHQRHHQSDEGACGGPHPGHRPGRNGADLLRQPLRVPQWRRGSAHLPGRRHSGNCPDEQHASAPGAQGQRPDSGGFQPQWPWGHRRHEPEYSCDHRRGKCDPHPQKRRGGHAGCRARHGELQLYQGDVSGGRSA